MAVPPKYRALGSFYRYYGGERRAPILTIFVGGNHEASQPLQELYYGGWVAPNIYYMGAAGVVSFRGIRIGGISGIYKSHDYQLGRFEKPPFDRSALRSIYHVRNLDVYRLQSFAKHSATRNSGGSSLHIMISHDWPRGIEQHGDTEGLLRRKPFFREEVQGNCLGSPPNEALLEALRPKWWFAAHLHVKFKATVNHKREEDEAKHSPAKPATLVPSQVLKKSTESSQNEAEDMVKGEAIPTSSASDSVPTTEFRALQSPDPCAGPDLTDLMTQFLSLDKCLPRRHCLSIIHIEPPEQRGHAQDNADVKDDTPVGLEYDPEWLAILRKSHHLSSTDRYRVVLPSELVEVTPEEVKQVRERFGSSLIIDPSGFERTVPVHVGPPTPLPRPLPPPFGEMGNPQTDRLLDRLELEHIVTIPFNNLPVHCNVSANTRVERIVDENEIFLDYEGNEEMANAEGATDENEINLEDENDQEVETEISIEDKDGGAGEAPSSEMDVVEGKKRPRLEE
jgi:lariat debranching enzyme